ncbi:Kelch domain-containing protein 10 [Galemys pyrenaicus]|uniref:Kelch domain-containing protein 10 n=1 Tax=Galemys pyrenaicus TaxID=202257 RepID=A0A8J6AQI7_GALPY|nr:Kelch domain-containing protein 10 [Galemys pyrenaicus]
MSAAQGWDRNRRRGGGAAGGGGGGSGASGGSGGNGGRGTGQLNRFVQLSGRPHLPGHRPPPARSGHRCVADNTNLYVFGGYNPDYDESGGPDNEDYPLFRELWRYHFATGVWHQMGTDGYMPRELASMSLVLHGNNLLVFGGTGIPFGESNGNDVHVCNVKYKRWALLSCRGKKPSRIYGQVFPQPEDVTVVFKLKMNCLDRICLQPVLFLVGEPLVLLNFLSLRTCFPLPFEFFLLIAIRSQAGCMYIHGGVVNIHENKRTGSLFKIWLVVPSLLELAWEKLLAAFPNLANLSRTQLLHLGLTQGLIERLK